MKLFLFLLAILQPAALAGAPSAVAECRLELSRVSYEQAPEGQVETSDPIEEKTARLAFQSSGEDNDLLNLRATLGGFTISAVIASQEQIVSELRIADGTHAGEWFNSTGTSVVLASLTNKAELRKIFVNCRVASTP